MFFFVFFCIFWVWKYFEFFLDMYWYEINFSIIYYFFLLSTNYIKYVLSYIKWDFYQWGFLLQSYISDRLSTLSIIITSVSLIIIIIYPVLFVWNEFILKGKCCRFFLSIEWWIAICVDIYLIFEEFVCWEMEQHI